MRALLLIGMLLAAKPKAPVTGPESCVEGLQFVIAEFSDGSVVGMCLDEAKLIWTLEHAKHSVAFNARLQAAYWYFDLRAFNSPVTGIVRSDGGYSGLEP